MSNYLVVACPKCGHGYKVPREKAGHKAKCQCGHVWIMPLPPTQSQVGGVATASQETGQPGAVKAEEARGAAVAAQGVAAPAMAMAAESAAAVAVPVDEAVVAAQGSPAMAQGADDTDKRKQSAHAREEEEARKLVGRELGNFRIEDLLGIGGFGAVYRAFDKSLHRHVAVKVLPTSMLRAGKEKIQRFLLEARAAAKLSHPNIVTVHQICQIEGIYFIVMELVEGRSLAEMVKMKRLTPQEATRIITEATRALAHAHKRGLIHRDVKPGNIMVTSEGQVKMTDFGLARDIFRDMEDEDEADRAVGTPLYMSPEQCEGEEGDSRSDVYSMGATYYVALTRRPPYEGHTTEELMNRHRTEPPPDPRKYLPGVPAAVFRVIEKAMAKEPGERYQTATELLAGLEGLDFSALDPNADMSLENVSAQISALTPNVGTHVGAVIKDAARHADTSQTAKRLVDTIEKASPMKWWILVGGLVALICLAFVVVAVIIALRHGEGDQAPPVGPVGTVEKAPAAAPVHKPPTAAPLSGQPAQKVPAGVATPPSGQGTPPATAVQRSEQPAQSAAPEAPVNTEQEQLRNAKEEYEKARAFAKTNWDTDSTRVIEMYEYVIQYFGSTPYAEKAKQDLTRLESGEPLDGGTKPAEPTRPPKEVKPPASGGGERPKPATEKPPAPAPAK